jgi:hypothetical protein
MKPDGSLLCSFEPVALPYHESDESSSHLQTLFPERIFQYYHPIYFYIFPVPSFICGFQPEFCTYVLSPLCLLYAPAILSSLI